MRRSFWLFWAAPLVIACAFALGACGPEETLPGGGDDDDGPTTSGPGSGGSGADGGAGVGGDTVSSTGGTGGMPGTGGSGGGPMGCQGLGDPCTDCEVAMCNAVYCTCFDNLACGQLGVCLSNCPMNDQNCQQSCLAQNEGGISDGALLADCAATACGAQCPGYVPLDMCQKCLFTSCEPQMNKCLANDECTDLLTCIADCNGDSFCEQGCGFQFGGGVSDAQDVGDCLNASCGGQCQ